MTRSPGLLVLGIPVSDELLARWVTWLAPTRQPFVVDPEDELVDRRDRVLSRELLDTYELYGGKGKHLAWLTESELLALPRQRRADLIRVQVDGGRSVVPTVRRWESLVGPRARDQADGHRFVWWPSLLGDHTEQVLAEFVDNGRRPSQHRSVSRSTWAAAEHLLPRAEELAGTFPAHSGPNCFGAVMSAAGASVTEQDWASREPFEAWLSERTVAGGGVSAPGTVLVWRSPAGEVEHAAVTLGDGWALHKPSQGWMSPTKVLSVDDVIRSSRCWGRRLTRRRIV